MICRRNKNEKRPKRDVGKSIRIYGRHSKIFLSFKNELKFLPKNFTLRLVGIE
jgi:hypothetical protein